MAVCGEHRATLDLAAGTVLAGSLLFTRVHADRESGTIVWPNGADLSPRTLYLRSRDAVPHAS